MRKNTLHAWLASLVSSGLLLTTLPSSTLAAACPPLTVADEAIGMLAAALVQAGLHDHYNLVLTSDHGGAGTHHQKPVPEVLTVPFICRGPDITNGVALTSPVTIVDIAPTIAALLGVEPHFAWEGGVVAEALRAGTAAEVSGRAPASDGPCK